MKIDSDIVKLSDKAGAETIDIRRSLEDVLQKNCGKVIDAFHEFNLGEGHFHGSTGYGFHDAGREALDKIVARITGSEKSVVRFQFVSGTHAITSALFGILRPGDRWISITGKPYDTLSPVIGESLQDKGSLLEWGINFKMVEILNGDWNKAAIEEELSRGVKLVFIQRSCGYNWQRSFCISKIEEICRFIKQKSPQTVILVDNCYGEMVEDKEPAEAGVDIIAGSLIKNLGGGIAPAGGYVAGKAELVDAASRNLTAPGIGTEEGATLDINRLLFQGIFFSPAAVNQALNGAVWASCLMEKFGFEVLPRYDEKRTDIIQGIKMGSRKRLEVFCRGIQKGSPVDSRAVPTPVMNPGYRDEIVMAGGTFIQGSSIELSADGPLREPFAVYLQGGISFPYIKIGVLSALQEMKDEGLLK